MKKNKERSAGGSEILRHQAAAADAEVAHADDERITAHLARALAAPTTVLHEIVSDRIHLDIHLVPATADRRYITLVTAGMSARPMTLPAGVADRDLWSHAELCLFLPPDWAVGQDRLDDERTYWPIRLLKTLARLPHEYDTWLGAGHSIPNGDPARPYVPETKLAGAIVIPPFALGDPFFACEGTPPLHIFQLLPVTAAEMDFKLKHGADKLLARLETKHPGIYGPIDPARASAV